MNDARPGRWNHLLARASLSLTIGLAGLVAIADPARGQGGRSQANVYPDESITALALLRNADNHAKNGQFGEAIEIYQRVIDKFGDKVVKVPPPEAPAGPAANPAGGEVAPGDSVLYVDARIDCQRRIAALPPEARALYRARVDSQAERWFKQAVADRDRALLRRVIEQAFCSSWGDEALDLLGDLSFQDGQFAEAIASYRRLVPDRAVEGQGLTHPDPSVDLARVAAKKLLCRVAIGEDLPTPADLEAYAKAYPEAKGSLAGRSGPLATIVSEAIRSDRLTVPIQPDGRWPTFAGAPTRTKVAPGSIDVGSLQWRVPLDPVSPSNPSRPFNGRGGMMRGGGMYAPSPANVPPDRLLAYHPIVIGDQVVVADERSITAYNLNQRPGDGSTATAAVAWQHIHQGASVADAARPSYSLPRYTLTAFGDRIYARMGPPPSASIGPFGFGGRMGGGGGGGGGPVSHIVALDRAAEGKVIWKKSSSEIVLPRRQAEGGNRSATFEGTPVADARNVYVALTDRSQMTITATYVACLDADKGTVRWVRYICDANAGGSINPTGEISHRLLTLDGPNLYYQTNLGAVAALDVEAGGIRWLATYPCQGRAPLGSGQERDLNPAVVHDGLVIVAPDDAPHLFAFDAATGRMAWKTKPLPDEINLTHLLGVAKGRVVATGNRVLQFDVKTGVLVRTWPDSGQVPQGFGRGILAGDRIYWPTETEIHVLDQASGLRAEPPIKLKDNFQTTGGNLAVGDGFLIVAQANSLVVFCQNRRLIERYRDEIARAPDRASNYYRMAQAAEASGLDELALASLDQVLERARESETIDGLPLVESARDRQNRLLMKQGEAARKTKDWATAIARFARAAEVARSDRSRLSARLDLAEVQLASGKPALAASTLQSLLADEGLRPLVVVSSDGRRSVRADLLIADRLAAIVREHGRPSYAEYDRAAEGLLDRGVKERDPRLIADVGRSYPVARVVPEAWLALGRLHDGLGQPQQASQSYKKLLAADAPDALRARASWGLAQAYEVQRLWAPAREAYLEAAARFGDQTIESDKSPGRLADLVSARLASAPFDRMTGESNEPPMPVPLARRWGRQWPATLRPLAAAGVPPSVEQGRIFLVEGSTLRAVDPDTGSLSWSANLGSEPIWVGYLADRLIAATRSKIAGLGLGKGAIEWQYDLAASAAKAPPSPFARPEAIEAGREASTVQLQDFRLVGGRVICLKGDQAIMAFDGDTGQVDWSYAPAAGRINPRLLVGPSRIVFQLRRPNSVVVLDTATGRRRAEFPQSEEEEWSRDPLPIDDDHVALVADRRTIALFDVNRGVNAWVFRESKELPTNGPPRLVGDAERLLVLHNGRELIRLDAASGSKRWSRPLGDEDLSERPDALALAGDRLYLASGSDLIAIDLHKGETAWRRKLIGPSAGWSVALTDRCVAAYPNPTRLAEEDLAALPVVLRRRDTGVLVQRLLFPSPVTDLAVRLAPRGAFVATQAGLWALGDRRDPDPGKP
jgi:outer membrane protein assembly factor BamB/tetratricopeptide (TPR) repeat protein